MLVHIVCWKYRAETNAKTRKEHISRLRTLPALITGIVNFEVGTDILHLDRSFDTGLVALFTDRDALDNYTDHPSHREVAAMGKQIAEKVISVDFIKDE